MSTSSSHSLKTVIQPEQCSKLIQRLRCLIACLTENNGYIIHRHTNQFFHMQKVEELKILLEQLERAKMNLEDVQKRMDKTYTSVFLQWRQDVRWLNQYLTRDQGAEHNP